MLELRWKKIIEHKHFMFDAFDIRTYDQTTMELQYRFSADDDWQTVPTELDEK